MKDISATYKGIATGLLMIALCMLFFYGLHLPVNGQNQLIILLISIAGVLWSLYALKRKSLSVAGFKDYFSEGFKTFIVIALFMAVFTFVFYKLNPQIMENGIKENEILAMKEGNHTPAEIKENSDKVRNIFMPMMLAISTIKYLILGSLVSLVGAGFLSKRAE